MPTPSTPDNARALRNQYRQWESRAARLSLLTDTGRELAALPPDAKCERVLQRAAAFCAMDLGAVLLGFDAPWRIVTTKGALAPRQWLESTDQETREVRCDARTEIGVPLLLQLPLMSANGTPLGALMLASSQPINPPDAEDLESLRLLAALLATQLENDRLHGALRTRERAMSELVHRLLTAQEEERRRVAYDLHDGLAQTLAGLHQRLQGYAARHSRQTEEDVADFGAILDLARRCVRETRDAMGGLRPQLLDDFGLGQAIDREADRLRDVGIDVRWQIRSDDRLFPPGEIALFRIAQEAINNILKHAHCSRVLISLDVGPSSAVLALEDDGVGFDCQPVLHADGGHHLGLVAMQERASLLGGEVACTSRAGAGTRLIASLPATGAFT
ncbi:sensor histidine kinase [Pseudomonas matsuisoli]|uniref:Oxygen sensor histidine kinase NreB n=1 Tax=Pseudomonas matsuisoli TaxID=1515666 RepID=A0A917PXL0_9PSED|nr:sensor histidine kinase [Pseudomonas matsuisoli]GGJ96629.1 two-component sensor histidine kinase [Pseudomonas matsuisoli]